MQLPKSSPNASPSPRSSSSRRRGATAPGLFILAGIVVVGLSPAVYFFVQAPRSKANFDASMAAEPTSNDGRLQRWMDYGVPLIDSSIQRMRISSQQPWLVTHTVAPETSSGDPAVYGIDLSLLGPEIVVREGMTVKVYLPEPEHLIDARLVGDNAREVPMIARGVEPPDPVERARYLAEYFLDGTIHALGRDIEGAELKVVVGGEPPASEPEEGSGGTR